MAIITSFFPICVDVSLICAINGNNGNIKVSEIHAICGIIKINGSVIMSMVLSVSQILKNKAIY